MSHPSLKAFAEDKAVEGVSKETSFRIDPNLIQFEPGFNLRQESDELEMYIDRLYNAMKAGAFIPAIDVSVVDGKIIARDGHCRTRAAVRVRAEMPEFTLACRQFRGNDADNILHMLGTGNGRPLSPLENGIGYLRLVKMGLTPVQIAKQLGVSRVTVDNGLQLAEAPLEVQTMIANGEVSATTAREAIKGGTEGVEALKEAVKEHRANPAKKKNGKKKKVTAKKLKGTKAAKKTKKAGTTSTETPAPATAATTEPGSPATLLPNGKLLVTVDMETAELAGKFLRDFASEQDTKLKEFSATLLALVSESAKQAPASMEDF